MKISTREDISAPIEDVFAAVSDFGAIERQFKRRGVVVERDQHAPAKGIGRRWLARATWRGRKHQIEAELKELTRDRGYVIESRTGGVISTTVVDLVRLAPRQTRLLLSVDLRPTTISSRLLVQSLKLAKSRLTERLSKRASDFAREIESRTI